MEILANSQFRSRKLSLFTHLLEILRFYTLDLPALRCFQHPIAFHRAVLAFAFFVFCAQGAKFFFVQQRVLPRATQNTRNAALRLLIPPRGPC